MDAAVEDLAGLGDHDLLAGGVADGVEEARAGARRWARLVEFHRRREAEARARGALGRQAVLTPRAETVTEVSALWGLAEPRVRHELNVALFLEQYFPDAWALCQAGQLDGYRATLVADHVRHAVSDPVLIRTLAARITDYLRQHLTTGRGAGVPTPAYARPIINLTVPIATVMGLTDDPGVLSGGTPVPAGLARTIAADPDATWHRMLTDPAGQMVELSTTSYKPTAPIWRHVVAQWGSCFEPACHAPATQVELDHRTPWPQGETRTGNLWPACTRGHTAKHSPGFGIEQAPDGSFTLRTRAGFTHPLTPPAQPTSDAWPDLPDLPQPEDPIQFCATELIEALTEIRNRRDQQIAQDHELAWEHDTLPTALLA